MALSEESVSFRVYYSCKYEAGGGLCLWDFNPEDFPLALRAWEAPTWRSLQAPVSLLRAALLRNCSLFPSTCQHCFYPHPFFNWVSVVRRMKLVKQKCWLSPASGCQANRDLDRVFGLRLQNFFGRSHRFLLGFRATPGSCWPAGRLLTTIPDQGLWGGTRPAVSSSGLGEGSEGCFLSCE